MGETGEDLARRPRDAGLARVERATDLADAVRKAAALAAPGSVVLLSPAFTSYDMFRDYEDRGRRFKATGRAPRSPCQPRRARWHRAGCGVAATGRSCSRSRR